MPARSAFGSLPTSRAFLDSIMKFLAVASVWMALLATTVAQNQSFVLSSRDRTQSLAVTFIATGQNGAPVTTLRSGDVTLRLGGKARPVLSLEYVSTSPATARFPDVPAPYGSNVEPRAPRSLVLIVDEHTIRPGRTITVRDAVQHLLSGLAPDDRIALVTVPFGGLAVDLTADTSRVVRALGGLTAQSARVESADDAQCRTLLTLEAMTGTLDRLSVVDGPVIVIFFSNHQAAPRTTIRMMSARQGATPVGDPCDLRASTFTDLGTAAARAGAQFYVAHADLDQRGSGLEGLEHITGVTGGPLLHLAAGGGQSAIARILSDTSGHYVARVARDPSDSAAGAVQGVSVSVSRPGVTVWRAPRLVIPRPEARSATAPTTLDLMRSPRPARDLPLRITGHTFRDDGDDTVKLVVTFESPDPEVTLSNAMVGAFDAEGRLVAGLEMTAEALTHRPVVAALSVPPGRYRLRVAALESAGRAGHADTMVEASLGHVGPLGLSSLMVGLSRGGAFVPAMEFGNEPTAFGMIEAYGSTDTPPRVILEVATTPFGPALQTMPALVESTGDSSRSVVTAVLPIADLPPGDYFIRVTVTVAGHPSGRIVRTLRKVGGL